MSQAPPTSQRFTFSDALRDCFEPVFANFATLAILALLMVALPYAVFDGIAGPPPMNRPGVAPDLTRTLLFGGGQTLNGVAQLFAAAFMQGATAVVLVRQLSGGKATVRDALRGVGASAWPLVGIALITVVVAVGALLIALIPSFALLAASRGLGALALVLGVLVVFAVGLLLLAGWAASAPIATLERLGPLAALARSWRLSRGSRWPILGVMALAAVLSGVISAIVALPASLLLGVTVATMGGPGLLWPVIAILQGVGAAAGSIFYSAAPAAVYWNLRRAKEGAVPADLAAVFD